MTALNHQAIREAWPKPRFGGIFRRLSRTGRSLVLGLAGKSWNPIFSVVEHVGRRSGRQFATPVAARRVSGGFVISLAFGSQADWHRNLIAAESGTIRHRGRLYSVQAPKRVDPALGRAAFAPVQRFFLRIAGIDGYVYAPDTEIRP